MKTVKVPKVPTPRGLCGKRPSLGVSWPSPITPMAPPCDRPVKHLGLCSWALGCVPEAVAAEILTRMKERT